MSLPFAPACLPLLLGGLPHRNAAQALEVSRRYAGALLAWPQLPQRSFREQSVVQSMLGFPGFVIDEAQSRAYVDRRRAERELDRLGLAYLEDRYTYVALSADDALGLDELLHQAEALRGVQALKGQKEILPLVYAAVHIPGMLNNHCFYNNGVRSGIP